MPSSNFASALLDAVDALGRRREVLRHPLDHVARELEVGVGVAGAAPSGCAPAAAAAVRPPSAATPARRPAGRRRPCGRTASAPAGGQQFALHRLAADDHVQRRLHPARAAGAACRRRRASGRASPRAAPRCSRARPRGSGSPAPVPGRRPCHLWMAATTGLAAILEHADHAQQVGLGCRPWAAELLDVGAARKGLAGARDHDGLHRRRRHWPGPARR
jgi:hypothetical protein